MFYSNDKLSIMPSQNIEPLSIAKLVNPQLAQAPAENKIPAIRAATFGKAKPTKSGKGGPAGDKKIEKTDEEKTQDVVNEVDKSLSPIMDEFSKKVAERKAMALSGANPNDLQKTSMNVYGAEPPSFDSLLEVAAQGSALDDFGRGGVDKVNEGNKFNEDIRAIAMKDYLAKASNPYRGVDLESIDRLTASTFGGKLQGMKNVTEPTNEFNQLVGAGHYIQKQGEDQAKRIGGYAEKMLAPKLQSTFGVATPAPVKPAGGRTAAQAQNADKYVLDTYRKIEEKNAPVLQKFEQLKGNLKLGTMSAVKSSLPILAKTVGSDVGNIALQEAERYMPATLGMSFANLLSYMESNPNYQVPKDTVKAIQAYVTVAEKEFKKRVNAQYAMTNETLKKSPYYSDPNARFSGTYMDRANTSYSPDAGGSSRVQELLAKAKKK